MQILQGQSEQIADLVIAWERAVWWANGVHIRIWRTQEPLQASWYHDTKKVQLSRKDRVNVAHFVLACCGCNMLAT